MKENRFKNMWVGVIFLLLTITEVSFGQSQPVVGDVKPQSEVFDFPIWKHLRQGQRDSAVAMTWEDYLGIDTVFAWNAVEKLMARFTSFSGKDSILVVTLDNGEDAIYRKKCKNRNKRPMDPTPKGGEDCPTWEMIFIYLPCKEKPVIPPPPPPPCNNCCPGDSLRFEQEAAAVFVVERTAGDLEKWVGLYYEWQAYKLHRNDKLEPWMERLLSYYAGINALVGEEGLDFKPTCDTCGYWGPILKNKFAFKSEVYFGLQQRVFKNYGIFGFAEIRYAWLNTRHNRNKLFSDEGFGMRLGVRGRFTLPKNFPVFREIKTDLGYQGKTYATTPDKLRVGGGGFAEIAIVIGARDKEVRQAEHDKKLQQARKQFVRDSIERVEKITADSLKTDAELQVYLEENPQPITLDSSEMNMDTSFFSMKPHAKKLAFVTLKDRKYENARGLNLEQINVLDLTLRTNDAKQAVLNGDNSQRPVLAKSLKELKQSRQKLAKFQKKAERFNKRDAKKKAKKEKS